MPFFIGIAGGSGCGKSTLAYGLQNAYPDLVEVVHFDDYQKEEEAVPFFEDMRNWDHPDAIDFDHLYTDLQAFADGKEVPVQTKSRVLNPTYEETGRLAHVLQSKPIIIVEGYMVFFDQRIRDFFDLKIFLDMPIEESMKRRDKVTYNDESVYNEKILFPMHATYVAPTKKYADFVIDVVQFGKEDVYEKVLDLLKERKLDLIF